MGCTAKLRAIARGALCFFFWGIGLRVVNTLLASPSRQMNNSAQTTLSLKTYPFTPLAVSMYGMLVLTPKALVNVPYGFPWVQGSTHKLILRVACLQCRGNQRAAMGSKKQSEPQFGAKSNLCPDQGRMSPHLQEDCPLLSHCTCVV